MALRNEAKLRRPNRPRTGPGSPVPIDLNSDDPLYLQLFHALKDEIVRGTYPVGATLPPEDELRKRYAVSRYTVRSKSASPAAKRGLPLAAIGIERGARSPSVGQRFTSTGSLQPSAGFCNATTARSFISSRICSASASPTFSRKSPPRA